MSILNVLGGAAQGLLMTGNPVGAVIGGVAGAIGGGSSGSGLSNAGNAALSTAQNAYLAGEEGLQIQNMAFQYQVDSQKNAFDEATDEKSEIMREGNELRNVAMEQRKADNEITKEFIKSIA